MFDFLQSYSIILVETICCVIFFEIFEDSNKRGKGIFTSRCIVVIGLSFLSCVEAYLLQKFELTKKCDTCYREK